MNITVVVSAIAGFSWLVVIGLLALTVLRASKHKPVKATVTSLIVAVVLALVLNTASAGLVFIQPQERGVVISAIKDGIRQEALQPGLNWIVPYAESVVNYSISRQSYTMSIANTEGQIQGDDSVEARTSDGQIVKIDATMIFAVNPDDVVDVHIKWQNTYVDSLVRPHARGVIREAISQYSIEEVYSTKRVELADQITTNMANRLNEGGLILVDFVLRNVAFSDEYADSVEQKQIAEQQAEQAALVVEQRKQEAEQARKVAEGQRDAAILDAEGKAQSLLVQAEADAKARVIRAEAEAEALELIAAVLEQNPDLLQYRYIEELAPNINVMLLPSDNPFLIPLPETEGLEQPVVMPTPVPTETPEETESP
ncbi:MAG: prohibitin family protein [Chloroflexota bacterium]|nr:prohibitin family protein [Chloroflexota bacterium]